MQLTNLTKPERASNYYDACMCVLQFQLVPDHQFHIYNNSRKNWAFSSTLPYIGYIWHVYNRRSQQIYYERVPVLCE